MDAKWHEWAVAGAAGACAPQCIGSSSSPTRNFRRDDMQADKLQNALSRCSVDPRATDVSRLMKQLDVGHNRYGVVWCHGWGASVSIHQPPCTHLQDACSCLPS